MLAVVTRQLFQAVLKQKEISARGIVNNGTGNVTIITETGSIKTAGINSTGIQTNRYVMINQPSLITNSLLREVFLLRVKMHAAYPMRPMAISRLSLAVFPRKARLLTDLNFGDSNTLSLLVVSHRWCAGSITTQARRLTVFTTLETAIRRLSLLVRISNR